MCRLFLVAVTMTLIGCDSSRTTTLFLQHYRTECVGVAIRLCFLAREDPAGDFELMYTGIEGFEYQWGARYELVIREIDVSPVAADASSIRRELVRIVAGERVPVGTTFDLTLTSSEGRITEIAPGVFRFHHEHEFECGSELPCDDLRARVADGDRISFQFEHPGEAGMPLVLRGWD